MKLILLASALLCVTPGCALVAPTKPAAEQSVVVYAEKSIEVAVATLDEVFRWEHRNRSLVAPEVTETLNDVRRRAPDVIRNTRSVLRAYKTGNQSIEQRQLLDSWIATLEQLATIARNTR